MRFPSPNLTWLAVCGLAAWALLALAHAPLRGAIRAGFAERDVSPSIGMREAHAVARHVFRTVVDPCKVRAAVLAEGDTTVALVSLDALMIPREVVLRARAGIARVTAIVPGAVLIAATHSHSSGPVGVVMPGQFDAAPADIRRLAYEESSLADPVYLARVEAEIVEAVRLAESRLQPVTLGFGFGEERQVAFNRRQKMKSGQTWSHAGAMNPDIVDYAGPIDPQVGVVGAWNAEGRLVGAIVNFACHATTNPGGVSANWPGAMERTMQGALRTSAPVLFFAGPSGDVTQVDNRSPFVNPTQAEWLAQVGGRIGAEATKVLISAPRTSDAPLAARQKVWRIARRVPLPERVAAARAMVDRGKPAVGNLTEWTFARETLLLDHIVGVDPEVEVEVQAIQVGSAVFLSSPAELFVAFGLEQKQRSAFSFTFPVSLANGCVGYVPTEEAFGPEGGGYETRLTFYSNLAITAGRQFAEEGLALAAQFRPTPAPERPRLTRPGTPWAHGRVDPQVR